MQDRDAARDVCGRVNGTHGYICCACCKDRLLLRERYVVMDGRVFCAYCIQAMPFEVLRMAGVTVRVNEAGVV